jgi:hypothetical protein
MEASPEYALRTLRIIVALTAVATAAVGLRFLSRWLSRAPLAADDGLIVLAWLFMLGLVVDCGYSMDLAPGAGLHRVRANRPQCTPPWDWADRR